MKRIFIALLLILSVWGQCLATTWNQVGGTEVSNAYVELESVIEAKDGYIFWFKTHNTKTGEQILTLTEITKDKRVNVLEGIVYDKNGEIKHHDTYYDTPYWDKIIPGSIMDAAYDFFFPKK